jgi:hypothetical protein
VIALCVVNDFLNPHGQSVGNVGIEATYDREMRHCEARRSQGLRGDRIGGCSDSLDNMGVVATVESGGGESHSAWRLQPT